jgi:hypothetical protein
MSTIAILIFIAIGLILLMRLNDREEGNARYRGSSLAGDIIAVGVLLGIGVLVLRAYHGGAF